MGGAPGPTAWKCDIRLTATSPQVPQDLREIEIRFLGSSSICGEIFGVLCQILADGIINEVRDALVGLRGLDPESSIEIGIKVDSGSPCRGHVEMIAS